MRGEIQRKSLQEPCREKTSLVLRPIAGLFVYFWIVYHLVGILVKRMSLEGCVKFKFQPPM